jgi:4-alpha-glucanotransferase
MLATLPLYATFLDDPYDPSPYSPISRLHWNEVYLDDDTLPAAPRPEADEMVDWRALASRRRAQLIDAASTLDEDTARRLERFVSEHPDVAGYARFRSAREANGDALVERSHQLAQLMCDEQLGAVRREAEAGLSLDLPVGSHPAGYETWAHPELFASATAVGAPPDTFFRAGQNWGFPPQLPGAMRSSGYALWRQMVERAARHCDLLRIDHVMAVHRLWWVPDGMGADRGVYVRYPREELLAVIAATAAGAGVGVVGENLGTVPPEVADALDRWQVLGMHEEQFVMDGLDLAEIPSRSVAGVRTHDMEAFAAFVADSDLSDYELLLDTGDVDRPDEPLYDRVLRRLAASDAAMVVADLDDMLDETRPHNLPGRVVPGIWQRRLGRPLADVMNDDTVTRRLDILGRTS